MNQLTSRYDYQVKQNILAGKKQPDRVTFYGSLMATMQLADTNNLARLYWAFPDAARESFIRYNAPDGCLTRQEWAENSNADPDFVAKANENEQIGQAVDRLFDQAASRAVKNLDLLRHNALAMNLIGLVPLSPAQMAAVVYKLRAWGFFNEDQKPQVINALVDLAVETAIGHEYTTHTYNAPVEHLIRAELEQANVFDIDQLPPRQEPGQAPGYTGDTWAGRAPKEDPGPMQYLYCQGWYIYACNANGYIYRLSTIQWECWRHAPEDAHLEPFAVERYALTEAMQDWDQHGPYWSPVQFEGGHLHVNDLNDQEHAPEDQPESPF